MYQRAHIKQTTDEKDSVGCLLFCIVFLFISGSNYLETLFFTRKVDE